MRRRRQALTPQQRRQSAQAVLRQLRRALPLRNGMRLGIYLAAGSELQTRPIIEYARQRGCRVYVPVIRQLRSRRMWFVPLQAPLRRNRFGIEEPRAQLVRRLDARWLDLVLVPLLAFGPGGERLGSGAGFYDRSFAYLRNRRTWHKPRLAGLGYEWQQVERLEARSWDVPLHWAITEQGVRRIPPPGLAPADRPRQ